ncbi:MAG: Hsp20/alpha crystallin family protein [Thermodesulfobacteriota bacterium]
MTLNRWDPLRHMLSFHERVSGLLEAMNEEKAVQRPPCWNPAVDILETPDAYVFVVELPGVGRDNINVELHGDRLIVFGERRFAPSVEDAAYHIIESRHGTFERQFKLPADADVDEVKAHYHDGVLHLRFAKTKAQAEKKVSVVAIG